jgi:hypothetical protein
MTTLIKSLTRTTALLNPLLKQKNWQNPIHRIYPTQRPEVSPCNVKKAFRIGHCSDTAESAGRVFRKFQKQCFARVCESEKSGLSE